MAATSLLDGSQEQSAPMTKRSVSPRQLYFSTFLANPAWSDSGESKMMVRSMIMLGVDEVTTMSGLRVEFSKTLLTRDV